MSKLRQVCMTVLGTITLILLSPIVIPIFLLWAIFFGMRKLFNQK